MATLDYLKKEKIINNSNKLWLFFHKELKKISNEFKFIIDYTFGKGLIGSIIFKKAYGQDSKMIANLLSQKCLDKGLLVCNTGRESVKLGPPLIINKKTMSKSIRIIKESLSEVLGMIRKKIWLLQI